MAKKVGKNGVGERDLAEPELDGRYIPPVGRRKEGKKVNEGNVAVLEGKLEVPREKVEVEDARSGVENPDE